MEDPAPLKSGDFIDVVPVYALSVDKAQLPAPPVLHGGNGNAPSSKLAWLGSSSAHGGTPLTRIALLLSAVLAVAVGL